MTRPRCSFPKPARRKPKERKQLRPSCTPITRESEKAKARRLSAISGKKRTAPKASNPARRKREWARAYHSQERVAFVQRLPCCVCVSRPWPLPMGESQNAHTESDGAGRKAGYQTIAPICHAHHRNLHQVGAVTFARFYAIDLAQCAANTQAAWLAHLEAVGG